MAKTKIGKVKILLKGEYNADTQYIRLDGVTYNGSFYICKQDCQGINVDNQEYWQLAAEKGDKPINGVDYNTEEEKAEFKKEIISEGKMQLDEYNVTKKAELDAKEVELEGALNNKKDELIIDIDDTLNGFEDNVEQKVADFNTNASEKTASFNQNAQTQTSAFDSNAETQTEKFNTNATSKTNGFDTNATEKTTSFDTNATEKTTAFDTNATSKTNEYNSNATQLTTQTDDLFDALTTNEASGTEIYIDDAKACRVINSEIDGMYQQETTSGKNLLEVVATSQTLNGITFTINEDKTITANGTATGTAFFVIGTFSFIANTNYILNGCPTGGAITTYHILIADTANAYDIGNGYNCVFTEDTTKNIVIRVKKGATVNNIVFKPMISLVGGEFEKYTGGIASPNPNYQQKIEQIKEVKYCGTAKNLLNFNEISGNANNFEYSVNGTYININGTPSGTYAVSNRMRCHIKKNEVVTIKITSAKSGTYRLWIRNKKNEMITNPIICNASASGIKTIIVKDNVETVQLVIEGLTSGAIYTDTITIQIEKGQNATEIEEYKNQAINIDLKGNKLCAISDTIKDKLLIDRNGNVALQKNIGKNIFDGTKKWKKSSYTGNTIFYLTNTQKAKFPDVGICNYLPVKRVWNTDILGLELYDLNNIRVGLTRNSEIQTEDAFNEWLTTHNLEVYYVLATPEIIDLGQLPELPKTFDGINNIWAETNLGNTQIEIEYVQDIKKLLEQTQAIILNNVSEEVTE